MKNENKNLSERLRYALQILGVSQSELAKRIRVKPQIIQYLCASNSEKSKFTFDIADALNVDVTWLATGNGPLPICDLKEHLDEKKIPLLSYAQIRECKVYGKKLDLSRVHSWIPNIQSRSTKSFALLLNDRAMSPRFDLDTIIIIDPDIKLTTPSSSEYYVLVYLYREDFIVFRQLEKIQNTNVLLPLNTTLYKDVTLSEEDIIIGVCKEARWNN